ncbi:MAG: class I SAM-dependent methyltransferase [Anaeromyxobacter sp.]
MTDERYHFTSDWFTRVIPAWRALFSLMSWSAHEPRLAVEIGSHEGRSALWTLEHVPGMQHPDSRIHCIDIWDQPVALANFQANVARFHRPEQIVMHQGPSSEALVRLPAGCADMVYVDGDHTAPGVLSDLVLGFRVLKLGGVMICDDYLWSRSTDILESPKLAIDMFTNIYRAKIALVSDLPLYQIMFLKMGH